MDLSRETDEAVFRLASNCIYEIMKEGSRYALALQRLNAAYPEIERRCQGRTDIGLLHAFGYHVGFHDAVPRDRRHAILAFVFRSSLPLVRNRTYMAGWGEPLSETRRQKIAAILRWFIDRHSRTPDMARACTEWTADHDFVLSDGLDGALSLPTHSRQAHAQQH